ncbi:hypothetical protein FE257_005268 [Aspergillus nanangensis]|uniref:DUF803 domain membrane protein n=1 Tax=Aspergillus nanangensis TaxID=2582783 RepID=A0AAD4GVP4_ASPNN|nr:hypothetical protein FE257_005268 [Aspergillus nanangensis]
MAYNQEQSLAAGLLATLVSVAPTPTSEYVLASATPSPSPGSGHGNGGEGGPLHEWSSLIGIVTALAGNVLISLALNIQRYAHIRIGREHERDKAQQEQDWKSANSDLRTSGPYGAVSRHNGDDVGRGRDQSRYSGRYRDESPSNDQPHIDAEDHDDRDGHSDFDDRMHDSFLSDRTARPGDKDLRRKSYLRSSYWWVGIVLMCLGETGNFMAYGFAPASIVSPLGVVALISNCVIAPFMLKEQFRTRDFWGVLIAIAGAVVVVLSAKSSEEKIGPHEIWVMITRWEFELYLGLTAALIVALMWASSKYGPRTILIDVGLVALFGGYTALSTKGVSSLLSFTLWHVITFPVTYLLVFVLVFSALMQIRYINRALQRFDSTQVIPTQFVLFTLSVIIGSAVLYRDFQSYTAQMAGKFVGGCLLTFLGVYFITSGRVRNDDESSFSADDEEEAIGLLGGEQYRDRVGMPPRQKNGKGPGLKPLGVQDDELQSPSGSLISQGIEGIDDGERTPIGVLSATPSSPVGSLTAESVSEPSPAQQAHSLLRNPWADMPEPAVATPKSEPQIRRPSTPDKPHYASDSAVLLRFPSAPGAEDITPHAGSSSQGASRNNTVPQTPPSRRLRGSISSRFSPGPLLPTISAGFSAVVAESIRRGETSPFKERRHRKRISRGGQPGPTVVDGFLRTREGLTRDPGYDTDGSVEGEHNPRFALATGRLHSTGDLATAPVTAGNSTAAVDTQGIVETPHVDDLSSLNRLRSLSDSWSGGVAWLGAALRKPSSGGEAETHSTVVESQERDEGNQGTRA